MVSIAGDTVGDRTGAHFAPFSRPMESQEKVLPRPNAYMGLLRVICADF